MLSGRLIVPFLLPARGFLGGVGLYKGFLYQAASWKTARRVVAKVEFHFRELCSGVRFNVTNIEMEVSPLILQAGDC